MDTTDEEDENGDRTSSYDHQKVMKRDSLEDLRVWRGKSDVLFTVMGVALITSSIRWWPLEVVLVGVWHTLEQNVGTKHDIQRDYLQSECGDGFVSPEAQVAFMIRWLEVSFGLFLTYLLPVFNYLCLFPISLSHSVSMSVLHFSFWHCLSVCLCLL